MQLKVVIMRSATLVISIPEDIEPAMRRKRYSRPIDVALKRAGKLGRVAASGTGFSLGGSGIHDTYCEIEVDVDDVAYAVPIVRDVLVQAHAPAGTTVCLTDAAADVVIFGPTGTATDDVLLAPGAVWRPYPWNPGDVVALHLASGHCVLFHALENALCPSIRVIDWCGPCVPEEAEVRQLANRTPARPELRPIMFVLRHRAIDLQGGRVSTLGVQVPVAESVRQFCDGVQAAKTWDDLCNFLLRLFGLV